ncbi:MAG: PorT family protein [Prevotella sp.]|nr:PorT family protein [Prevotella sp.]
MQEQAKTLLRSVLLLYLFTFFPFQFFHLSSLQPFVAHAQIGDHRSDFSLGINGGCVLSNVGFSPKVTQGMHTGVTGGISFRYVCEKYFNTICSVYGEVNYAETGWKEDIVDINDQPVLNTSTGVPEEYSRTMKYIQIPILAHLAWGREDNGLQFYVNLGPQFGYYLSESTATNFTTDNMNLGDRANKQTAQYAMSVENKFDYGIAVGGGFELSLRHVGHFLIDGRYYYGLGNIYGDSKRDYFAKSNLGNVTVKVAYLFDILKYKGNR